MKTKLIIIIGILLISNIEITYSHEKSKSLFIEIRYPTPLGNNFLNKGPDNGYLGIFDIGIGYKFLNFQELRFDVSFNTSQLRLSQAEVTLTTLNPQFGIQYLININKLLIFPKLGVGYTNWRFRSPSKTLNDEQGRPYRIDSYKENTNGINIEGSISIEASLNRHLDGYVSLSYYFTRLEKPNPPVENVSYNRGISYQVKKQFLIIHHLTQKR